jgi:hypothetical protein
VYSTLVEEVNAALPAFHRLDRIEALLDEE